MRKVDFEKIDEQCERFMVISEEEDAKEYVPIAERLNMPGDVEIFNFLVNISKNGNIISAAEHDEIYLDFDMDMLENVTDEQIRWLISGGVFLDEDSQCFAMFT